MNYKFRKVLTALVINIPERGGEFVVAFDGNELGGTLCFQACNGNTEYQKGDGFYPLGNEYPAIPYPSIDGEYGLYNAFINPNTTKLPKKEDMSSEAIEFLKLFNRT